jgi:hypothetical protein
MLAEESPDLTGDSLKLSGLGKDRNGKPPMIFTVAIGKFDSDGNSARPGGGDRNAQLALDGCPGALALPTSPVVGDGLKQICEKPAASVIPNAHGCLGAVAVDARVEVVAASAVKPKAASTSGSANLNGAVLIIFVHGKHVAGTS